MAERMHGSLGSERASDYRFWADKAFFALLLLALLLNVTLLIAILGVYPQLPERLPILFNAQGQADLVVNKAHLFRLPLGLLLVTLFNVLAAAFVLRGSAFGARMVLLASCWTALLLLVGLWFIVS